MTLDVRVMRLLDDYATKAVLNRRVDEQALNLINKQMGTQEQPYLRNAYLQYYYKAKQHARDDQQ